MKGATIQIGGTETAEQVWDVSRSWTVRLEKFDGSGDSKINSKAEEKKSESFQRTS